MPIMVIHHEVKDVARWLASPKREEVFSPVGVATIRTFTEPRNANHVALAADLDALETLMQSDEAATAMEHDGVLPETLVLLIEA